MGSLISNAFRPAIVALGFLGIPVAHAAPTTHIHSFPLTEGDRWEWEVVRTSGAGARVMLISASPATSEVIETWELLIGKPDAGGAHQATWTRTPRSGAPASTARFTLARHADGIVRFDAGNGPRPAFSFDPLPNPVSVEQQPCVAHVFGDVPGGCSLLPGGPLGIAPGPTRLVLNANDDHAARALVQWVVGIASAGTVIPGNRGTQDIATLVSYQTTRAGVAIPEELARWANTDDLAQVKRDGPLDAETAAAMISVSDQEHVNALTALLIPRLSPEDRYPALRVALRRAHSVDEALSTIAQMAALAPFASGAHLIDSVKARLPEDESDAVAALLERRWPVLAAALRSPADTRGDFIARRVGSEMLALGEARALLRLVRRTDEASLAAVMSALVRALPDADADVIMFEALADSSLFDTRIALVQGETAWVARQLNDHAASRRLFTGFTFDSDRVQVFDVLRRQAAPEIRGNLLVLAVESMEFDGERLGLLRSQRDLVASLTADQRRRCLKAFRHDTEDAARVLNGAGDAGE